MKENTGVITKLDSKLIIKMHNIEYFISIIEIKKNFTCEQYKPEIKNKENIDVGVFFKTPDRKKMNIIIGGVTFTSDLDELKKLIEYQLSEIPIYSDRPDSPLSVMAAQKFNSPPHQQITTMAGKKSGTPSTFSFRDSLKMKFYITSLWHFTHVKNLESIMKLGIFSRKLCQERGLTKLDISDKDIVGHRTEYHNCVPLFFAACPPMVFRIMKEQQEQLVALAIDPKIMDEKTTTFSDGNVRAKRTKLFTSLKDLNKLNWDLLHLMPSETVHFQTADNKLLRSAEVLVKDEVPLRYITSLSVPSGAIYNTVKEILKKENLDIMVFINLETSGVNILNQ